MTSKSQIILTSDEELISRIIKGEKRLFEVIVRRYNQRLYRVGMSIIGIDVEVEDAMQAAYIKTYENLQQFENRSSFSTWITRIMLNQCFEQMRKNKRTLPQPEQSENLSTMKTPANDLMNKELKHILELAIAQLPEKYRLVFTLRELEDMSIRATSEALNIEEANVKVRLNRAKSMLKTKLSTYMKDQVFNFHLSRCDKMVNGVLYSLGIE